MTDAAAGVREMVRVTRPGGVVAACVWDFAGRPRAAERCFFAALASVVTGHRRRDATAPAPARATSARCCEAAGCTDVDRGAS